MQYFVIVAKCKGTTCKQYFPFSGETMREAINEFRADHPKEKWEIVDVKPVTNRSY
ncbi:hypothetical protein NNG48_07350 [Enterococcus faecium]|nr:hypothetical protein [Enterococcus faecium]